MTAAAATAVAAVAAERCTRAALLYPYIKQLLKSDKINFARTRGANKALYRESSENIILVYI